MTYDTEGDKTSVTKGGDLTSYCYYADTCASAAPSSGGTGTQLYSTTRPPSQADPTGEVTTATYDATGQVSSATTPALSTAYAYDAAGHVVSITYSGVATGYAAPADVTETYGPTGERTSMTDGTGTTTYTYDDAGDLTSSSFAPASGSGLAAISLSYGYYPTGQPSSVTYPSFATVASPTVAYTYDTTANMASVTDWLGNTTTFAYTAGTALSGITYPNTTTASVTNDATGLMTGLSVSKTSAPTSPLATIAYTRNATEQVTAELDGGALSAQYTYAYDASGRLATTGTHAVAYDTATAPTTLPTGASATYDAAGELTSATLGTLTTTYAYDSIGDETQVAPSTGPTLAYGYDALGRLVSATSSATTGPLAGTGVRYAYNGDGLRMGVVTTTATATFAWDLATSLPAILSDGTSDFVYGPTGMVVEQVGLASGTPEYLVHDQIGSTRLVTDAAGTVVGTSSYDPYGTSVTHSGAATSPIGYAGGFTDAATGLLYLVNRYYTAETGSFLSVDPMVATTTAPYVYATGDPVNQTDATGLRPRSCGQGIGTYLNPFESGSCFKAGWDTMSGSQQIADATLPITLPLTGMAAVTGVGALAGVGVLGESAGTTAGVAVATGAASTALDYGECFGLHQTPACFGAGIGSLGLAGVWIGAVLGGVTISGGLAGALGFALSGTGSVLDMLYQSLHFLFGGNSAKSSNCRSGTS